VTDVAELLDRVATGYAAAYEDLYALTRTTRDQARGKPTSRPPTGVDVSARKRLVEVARALLDAHYVATDVGQPRWSGFTGLGFRAPSPVKSLPHDLQLVYQKRMSTWRLYPLWVPDPDDAVLKHPNPGELRGACKTTGGMIEGIPERDGYRIEAAVTHVWRAHGTLQGGGAFNERQNTEECTTPWCRRPIEYRTLRLCRPCYQTARRLHERAEPAFRTR
jgi:hypothetical protein